MPYIIYCLITLILVLADQFSKHIAIIKLKPIDTHDIINGVLNFTYVENKGAAWGVFSGKINLFIIVTSILIPFIIYFIYKSINARKTFNNTKVIRKFKFLEILLILIISGALGNFIDRIRYNYVVDFIHFKLIEFPVFNLADCYISIGAFLFALLYIFKLTDEEISIITPKRRTKKNDN